MRMRPENSRACRVHLAIEFGIKWINMSTEVTIQSPHRETKVSWCNRKEMLNVSEISNRSVAGGEDGKVIGGVCMAAVHECHPNGCKQLSCLSSTMSWWLFEPEIFFVQKSLHFGNCSIRFQGHDNPLSKELYQMLGKPLCAAVQNSITKRSLQVRRCSFKCNKRLQTTEKSATSEA